MAVLRGKAGTAEKGKSGAVSGHKTVVWWCFMSSKEGIKVPEDGFECVRAEFVPLLVQGRWRWGE